MYDIIHIISFLIQTFITTLESELSLGVFESNMYYYFIWM